MLQLRSRVPEQTPQDLAARALRYLLAEGDAAAEVLEVADFTCEIDGAISRQLTTLVGAKRSAIDGYKRL